MEERVSKEDLPNRLFLEANS